MGQGTGLLSRRMGFSCLSVLMMAGICSSRMATHKAYTSVLNLGSHDTRAIKDENDAFIRPEIFESHGENASTIRMN